MTEVQEVEDKAKTAFLEANQEVCSLRAQVGVVEKRIKQVGA